MSTRPYQGFPYTNPHVNDAPTVDAETASRWNNLPRRPIRPPGGHVVYVDLPEEGSQVSRPNETQTDKKDPEPRIYIDVPDNSSSDVAGPASPPEPDYSAQRPNETQTDKKDPEPRIYIDVPDNSSGDVAGPASPEPEPEYVHETIFYDPFENRRIERQKSPGESNAPPGSGTAPRRPAPRPPRPTPPSTLDLHGAGSSDSARVHGRHDDFRPRDYHDRFRPSPVSPYPEPPPAYTEIDTPHTPQMPQSQRPHTPHTTHTQTPHTPQTPPESQPSHHQEPPRTIVITHSELPSPIGLASADRKVVICHHCGQRVHTLVIRESGPVTHAIAVALICLMLLPIIVLLYWTNGCKYRNHYCPNCNKKIGYEYPALCIKMTYTS